MASLTDDMSRYIFPVGTVMTTTTSSSLQQYYTVGAQGAILYVDVTAASGTSPTLVVTMESRDPASGKFVQVPGVVTASITSVSTNIITIAPGLVAVANSVVNTVIPNNFRITATIGGTTPSFTLSIGLQYTF